jgi:hypothetical protein
LLLYHGQRWLLPDRYLTGKWAKSARLMPTVHERDAAELALLCFRRFWFMVSAYRPLFAQHRADQGDATLTDLKCLQALLRGKLSPAGQEVLEMAIPLWRTYNGLLLHFHKRLRRGRRVTGARLQRLMLHASIAFEDESNEGKPAWDGGLSRISEHFYFLNAYFDVEKLCEWVAARAEPQTADADVEAAYLLQFRVFFLAVCRALQEGENEITPTDAVWLGLIDTVRQEPAADAPLDS